MPKKPTPLKDAPLKNPIGMPIEPKKKKPLKKPLKGSSVAIRNPFEQAVDIFGKHFSDADKKNGFELYQFFRDAMTATMSSTNDKEIFLEGTKFVLDSCITKIKILEDEYIENFIVSMTLKESSPDSYANLIPIIDKHIRPKKQRQGVSLFKESMAGIFVFLLSGGSAGSIRQASNIASQLFDLNMTYVEKSYKNIKNLSLNKDKIIKQDVSAMLAVYGTIKYFEGRFPKITAIQQGNTRSENEFKKAILAFEDLSQLIINHNIPLIKIFLKKFPKSYIAKFIEEETLTLDALSPTVKNAFHILGMVFFIEFMPNLASQEG